MPYSKNILEKILPIWQPVGLSTHLISQRTAEHFKTKTSHTGTLDPMAQGVVIVLLGEERLKKKEYAKWKKGYEFEITLGLTTDTYDGMGLITDFSEKTEKPQEITKKEAKDVVKNFEGNYKQKIPPFSTKKIRGKHLHQHAREGNELDLPTKTGIIYKLDYIGSYNLNSKNLTKDIINRIKKVTGDFRQKEIIKQWKKFAAENEEKAFRILKFYVETSKGIYVRSLTQDLCRDLKTTGFAYKITRTKNGKYTKQNSKKLEEIFGSDYKIKIDFVSKPNLR